MFLKLEKYLFYIFLFSISFQTRKILWYSGWKFNEWQSFSLYGTDMLLGLLLLCWAVNSKFTIKDLRFKIHDYFLFIFLAIAGISIISSGDPMLSRLQWAKLLEFTVFYYYVSRYALAKFGLANSFLAILIGGLFQAGIAIAQFVSQSNLGLKYFGESVLNKELPGVASFYLPTGEKIIRAYGTTPHPNVLAASLLLAMFAFYFLYFYSRLHGEDNGSKNKLLLLSYCVMLFAFFSTFSRVAVFIWFVSFCARSIIIRIFRHYRLVFGTKEGRRRIAFILIANLIVIVLFSSLYFNEIVSRSNVNLEDQAVKLRIFYNKEALGTHINYLGVGMGNFVGWLKEKEPLLLTYAYQPVHNIYLLIYSETGILGLASFVLFLIFLIKDFILRTRLKKSYHLSALIFLFSLLFIGFFDHFLWTLQQGRIILWFTLSFLTFLSNRDRISI